ncbi:LysR family transcriptional regulator [Corticibacterium sp. UT-5YL-CI-8]|nr:LysR family transcriptional regulator [Tianweitania sp. UT-5YL-CI-8]
MRFRNLDLNLLVALEALLDELSVTKAANRLHLSQAATSNALTRLRDYFGDDLLVRVGRKMMMTDRARVIHAEVRDVLRQIDRRVLAAPEFHPEEQQRTITIMTSDVASVVFMASISRRIAALAPGIVFNIRPIAHPPHVYLEQGRMDFLLIPRQYTSPTHPMQELYREPFACLLWKDSALAKAELTADAYLASQHVTLEIGQMAKVPADRNLIEQTHGMLRSAVMVNSFTAVPWMIVGTDRIGTVPESLASQAAGILPLVVKPLPFDVPENRLVLQWGKFAEEDACLKWVRQIICERPLDTLHGN